MDEYKKPYLILFNGCEAAIQAMEKQNYGQARELLIQAEQAAEEAFMAQSEEN